MKRTMIAIPLATALLGAAESPQSPTKKSDHKHAQHVRISKKHTSSSGRGERNAFFVGADYQLGMFTSTEQACADAAQCDGTPRVQAVPNGHGAQEIAYGNMGKTTFKGNINARNHVSNGFGVVVGYKHFFKKLPELGMRYYGFFDYNASDYRYFKSIDPNSNWNNSMYHPTNIFAYGVGTDVLFNPQIFNKENFHFGFFAGAAIGGSSFGPMNWYYKKLMETYGGHMRISSFNFFLNGGIRFGTKHNGFEVGIKIPLIRTNYYTALGNIPAGLPFKATLQRDFAFYWRYLVDF
ncbi:outer membrane protein [Helicobacter suis]|uniref:outer membrane protein n=1 Tax=Helicobacter suis TaxID=104628 RepID=UPI0013CF4220|nr:outer membrane protein [Helicobacter suis]